MNVAAEANRFQKLVGKLIDDMDRATAPNAVDGYANDGATSVLEHKTRKFFLDELISGLGWKLGAGGNVAEEARIKINVTTYMDYVGVTTNSLHCQPASKRGPL